MIFVPVDFVIFVPVDFVRLRERFFIHNDVLMKRLCAAGVFAILLSRSGHSFTLAAVNLMLVGFFGGLFAVPLNALLQQRSGDQEKGRLMATNNFLNMAGILLSAGALWVCTTGFGMRADRVILVFGLAPLPSALAAIPVIPLTGLLFAAIGMAFTLRLTSIDLFSFYFTLFLTPLFLFSDIFFPLAERFSGNWLLLAELLPLLHPVRLARYAFYGDHDGYPSAKLREFHDRFAGSARLINVYGPTETSCICSSVEITPGILTAPDSETSPK